MIPFPDKKYDIIYADPPWSYSDKGCNGNAAEHYPTMTVDEFQWVKQNRSGNGYFFGLGRWTRGNTEPCLLAVKGKPKRISASVGQLVFSPLRRHSQKPDEVRDRIVELMGDLPRIELFARETAPGWDSWGNEVPTPAECEETNGQQTDRGGHEAEAAGQV